MLKYLKKYWFFCLLAPLFMIGEVAMDLLQPDMMADIVDNGVLKSDITLIITVGVKMILTVMLGGMWVSCAVCLRTLQRRALAMIYARICLPRL